jgi:DedD protein
LQDHLKERLTGAAILVIVVVLLVPELFRGPPGANLKAGTNASAGPPVRSYTIDLRDSSAAQPPGASAPAIAMPAAAAASASPNGPPGAPSAPVDSSAPPAAPALNPATPHAVSPATPRSATAAPSPHAAARASAAKSAWTVQVGSFARRDYAERMAKQVMAKGYAVEVAGPDDRGLYRVRSAPQAERAAATALKQKMQASGLKPIVNTVP